MRHVDELDPCRRSGGDRSASVPVAVLRRVAAAAGDRGVGAERAELNTRSAPALADACARPRRLSLAVAPSRAWCGTTRRDPGSRGHPCARWPDTATRAARRTAVAVGELR
jgi:hypothetical protein